MKAIYQFEVITITNAYSSEAYIDNRKLKKHLRKIIKCTDVTMVVYTIVTSKGKMLKDRTFCTNIKDIKL